MKSAKISFAWGLFRFAWSVAIPGALLLIGANGLRAPMAKAVHDVKQRGDVFLLPRPDVLEAATLGYRAAAVDWLWADLLVQNGIHLVEKRPFDDLERYLDGVHALEPTYYPFYKFVDTLLVYRPPQGTEADIYKARDYLRLGLEARPYDHRVWLHYGQFVAFLAPSFPGKQSQEDRDVWRKDGAQAIMKAVDLGADVSYGISAATILSQSGERPATIDRLQRQLALTDDENERLQIEQKLARLEASEVAEKGKARLMKIENRWRKEFPFLSRGEYVMLAPLTSVAACVGISMSREARCALNWTDSLAPPAR